MRCGYCFYTDISALRKDASMGVMKRETVTALLNNVFSELISGDMVTFAFQGGEPGLMGLDFFHFFTNEVSSIAPVGVSVDYAFQTNGICIDDDWCAFFKQYDFLIGLSLDGDASLHNQNRTDNHGKGTFNRVMDAKKKLDAAGVRYNILCVLTSESSRRAGRIWNFILREKIKYIQFIPCLEPLESGEEDAGNYGAALTGAKFFRFYSELFPLWKKEVIAGNYVSVKLFDDLIALLLHGMPGSCGLSGRCSPQIVVEADGGVYPCDFYVLDEYKAGDLTCQSLRDVFNAVVNCGFLEFQSEVSACCSDCAHNRWCKGGCKRMSRAVYGDICGMRSFLDKYLSELLEIGRF